MPSLSRGKNRNYRLVLKRTVRAMRIVFHLLSSPHPRRQRFVLGASRIGFARSSVALTSPSIGAARGRDSGACIRCAPDNIAGPADDIWYRRRRNATNTHVPYCCRQWRFSEDRRLRDSSRQQLWWHLRASIGDSIGRTERPRTENKNRYSIFMKKEQRAYFF